YVARAHAAQKLTQATLGIRARRSAAFLDLAYYRAYLTGRILRSVLVIKHRQRLVAAGVVGDVLILVQMSFHTHSLAIGEHLVGDFEILRRGRALHDAQHYAVASVENAVIHFVAQRLVQFFSTLPGHGNVISTGLKEGSRVVFRH